MHVKNDRRNSALSQTFVKLFFNLEEKVDTTIVIALVYTFLWLFCLALENNYDLFFRKKKKNST